MELNELKPTLRRRQKRRDKRMDEEVVECYRGGWRTRQGKGYRKRTGRERWSDIRSREGMKARHNGGSKYLTDDLEPLIRYIRSNVGQHWDKVYSELSRSLDRSTTIGQHVFDHLKHMVHTNMVKDGRRLITHDGRAPRDIAAGPSFRVPEFYVHPKSGVLMQVKPKRKRRGPDHRG